MAIMSIHLHLPYWKYIITIYMVHQIGFIPPSGGPCSNVLTMNRVKSYTRHCWSDSCMGGNVASLAPSCQRIPVALHAAINFFHGRWDLDNS